MISTDRGNPSWMTQPSCGKTAYRQFCKPVIQENRFFHNQKIACPNRFPCKDMNHALGLTAILFLLTVFSFPGCGGGGGGGTATTTPTYSVIYNGNGNTSGSIPVDSADYTEGETVTVLGNTGSLQRDGYTFVDWCVRTDGAGDSYTQGQTFAMGTDDVTLYANWTILNLAFGVDGIVSTDMGAGTDEAYALAIQDDNKILLAGAAYNGDDYDFAIIRYNTDGTLDTSFGTGGGIVMTDVVTGRNDYATAMAIQADGKIVVAGYSYNGANYDFALVRYNTNGALDTTFHADGKVTTDRGSGDDYAYALAIQADNRIVAAGSSYNSNDQDFALIRYNTDGSLDTTFDADGIVATDVAAGDHDYARALSIQADGKIVAAGYSCDDAFALVRCNTDGSLDTTFDADGIVTTQVGTGTDVAYAMAIQTDNKIVAAGYSWTIGVGFAFSALVRYNTDGSLDTTFDTDGIVTTAIGSASSHFNALSIRSDGKILAAGYSVINGNHDFTLARYNTNGSPDTAFGTNGIFTTGVGPGNDVAFAMAIQADGKILAAGYSYNGTDNDFALVRCNSN